MTLSIRLRNAYEIARRELLDARGRADHWVGELSPSALSTATAICALAVARSREAATDQLRAIQVLIDDGLRWLLDRQNGDGGWGDTQRSYSNIATTMLVRSAFHLAGVADTYTARMQAAERYIGQQGGVSGLRARYGRDKTFAVPILSTCALAGLASWREVSPLPFELACLPYRFLRLLRLPVVSYAVPALVAIGQSRYVHQPPWNPLTRLVRALATGMSLAVVEHMQPHSGGFLEAVPLTSFVVMNLAATGRAAHPVVQRGLRFLVDSVRGDGSWPIDTNLATWNTTLALGALTAGGEDVAGLGCLDWLLSCQHRQRHPFTDASPGGWGWSDLSGAVPDADDTSAALLVLAAIARRAPPTAIERIEESVLAGMGWLLDLQNADGGWPTFCRGWGALPFDRSAVDLTAHALQALHAWRELPARKTLNELNKRVELAMQRGLAYLSKSQETDGSWVPLWFGNQERPGEENPVYGTARVLAAYRDLGLLDTQAARDGLNWLVVNQCTDGGWGPPPAPDASGATRPATSVEETALAVEALLSGGSDAVVRAAVGHGLQWLIAAVESGRFRESSPIGFYFARLWYYERLYPLIFTVSALGRALPAVEA